MAEAQTSALARGTAEGRCCWWWVVALAEPLTDLLHQAQLTAHSLCMHQPSHRASSVQRKQSLFSDRRPGVHLGHYRYSHFVISESGNTYLFATSFFHHQDTTTQTSARGNLCISDIGGRFSLTCLFFPLSILLQTCWL